MPLETFETLIIITTQEVKNYSETKFYFLFLNI